jgi:hypothetical protein
MLGFLTRATSRARLSSRCLSSTPLNKSARVLTPNCGVVVNMGLHNLDTSVVHSHLMSHGVCFLRSSDPSASSVTDSEADDILVEFAKTLGTLEGPHPVFSPDPSSPLAVGEKNRASLAFSSFSPSLSLYL